MKLYRIHPDGSEEVLSEASDRSALKDWVRTDYNGEDCISWMVGVYGKAYTERMPSDDLPEYFKPDDREYTFVIKP